MSDTKPARVLNWGILGTARINRSLIPPLKQSTRNQLLGVASRSLDNASAYTNERGIERAYGTYEALLADPDIDVVYVPLPNSMHAHWAVKAAEAGKHVLCEKPLALTVEEVDTMKAAARQNKVHLTEAFMYRHHARTLRIKELLDKGAIGKVQHIKGAFSFPLNREGDVRFKSELGGGSLWDVGCYPLSFARYLLGTEPFEVKGEMVAGSTGVDMSFYAHMRFPNEVRVQFDSSFQSQFRMWMEVTGSEGVIYIPMAFKPDPRSAIHVTCGNEERIEYIFGNMLYLDEVEDLADAVLGGSSPRITLEDSRHNVAAIQALYRSARENTVVSL